MKIIAMLPVLALAACVEQPMPMPMPQPEPDLDACKASAYQGLVGQPKTVLTTMMLPAGSRVIGPTDAITMDYRIERLNVEIGKDDRIDKVACY